MAEAAAILGCISASGSIIVTITRTIKKLVELGKRFKEAGTTIKLLISQLSTIKSALQQIRDWADYTFADSPTQPQLAEDFRTAIDGCEAAMDALSEDVSNLVGNQTKPIGTGTRMKCVWNETTMKDHQDRLGHQIQALQLLVQASQSVTAAQQLALLEISKNRQYIQQVAADTATLSSRRQNNAREEDRSEPPPSSYYYSSETPAARAPIDGRRSIASSTPQSNFKRSTSLWASLSRRSDRATADLHDAVQHKNLQGARKALERGASTDFVRNKLHLQPLRPTKGDQFDRDLVDILLEYGTEPDSPVFDSCSLLEFVAGEGNLQAVKLLMREGGALDRGGSYAALKALHSAVSKGQIHTTEHLLLRGTPVDDSDGWGRTALWLAAKIGHRRLVELLLHHGANPNHRDHDQMTPLCCAAKLSEETVRVLLEEKADPDAVSGELLSPMHYASINGRVDILVLLLEYKARIDITDEDNLTPFLAACEAGKATAAQFLLNRGANASAASYRGENALHLACSQGNLEVLRFLLESPPLGETHQSFKNLLDQRTEAGWTALFYAVRNGSFPATELLLRSGDSVDGSSKKSVAYIGRPIYAACKNGNDTILRLLLGYRADLSTEMVVPSKDESIYKSAFLKPIHIAQLFRSTVCIEALSRCEEDISAPFRLLTVSHEVIATCHLVSLPASDRMQCGMHGTEVADCNKFAIMLRKAITELLAA